MTATTATARTPLRKATKATKRIALGTGSQVTHETSLAVLPVIEERVRIATKTVETGRVRIRKAIEEHQEQVDVPLLHEDVDVVRVPIDRPIERPMATRQEGDVTIIPVHEERVVTIKQLFLVEELHVTRRRHTELTTQQVTLRRERVEIQRSARSTTPNDAEGDSVADAGTD